MTNQYWAQWNSEEIMSMQGVEPCVDFDEEEIDIDEIEEEEECVYCPRCGDSGCNYCLMC